LFLSKPVGQIPGFTPVLHQRSRVTSTPSSSIKVTTIVKPGTVEDFEKTAEDLLPMAGIKAIAISRMFSSWPKEAKQIDRTDFLQLLKASNILHEATHGSIDIRSTWLSYVSLRQRFRILDLSLPETVNADLIVFAAFFSGLGTGTGSDEVVGFSHTMRGTGFRAYIGALWKVNDIATMLLFVIFYRLLKENNDGLSVAELWRRAQIALYR
jgi:CHAT domain-containing protein